MTNHQPQILEETLSSEFLYLGDVRVTEQASRKSRLRSGRNAKERLIPVIYWFLKDAPASVAIMPFRLIAGLGKLLYWLPGNRLRQSCEYVCAVAARAGHEHAPRAVYGRFLDNVLQAGRVYQRLFREGNEHAVEDFRISHENLAMLKESLAAGKGILVPCPHNPASVLSGMEMAKRVPMLAIMKNSATIRRTKLALDAFERMQLRLIMVRSGNPFELSRGMFSALKSGNAIAATVDNVDHSGGGVDAKIFGRTVPFAPWAAKIAAKKGVPFIPSFYHSDGSTVRAVFGEPLITQDLDEAVQHYVSFFEAHILEDPASWAYLADRRWRRVLQKAAESP